LFVQKEKRKGKDQNKRKSPLNESVMSQKKRCIIKKEKENNRKINVTIKEALLKT
jgi:hypothetical protein